MNNRNSIRFYSDSSHSKKKKLFSIFILRYPEIYNPLTSSIGERGGKKTQRFLLNKLLSFILYTKKSTKDYKKFIIFIVLWGLFIEPPVRLPFISRTGKWMKCHPSDLSFPLRFSISPLTHFPLKIKKKKYFWRRVYINNKKISKIYISNFFFFEMMSRSVRFADSPRIRHAQSHPTFSFFFPFHVIETQLYRHLIIARTRVAVTR